MGTIQRSTLGETPEAKAKWEVPAQYWADIAFSPNQENVLPPLAVEHSLGLGLSVLNDSKYGYDAKPDCLRLTLLRSPNWPTPNSDRGKHEFTYRLVPHQGDWREAKIVQFAQELNNPLVLQSSPIQSNQQSFLQVSDPNIILSAFKRSQDQSGWIIRFYESYGRTTETNIEISHLLLQIGQIWECDLMENKVTVILPTEINLNYFTVTFKPYEIKTFFCVIAM
jgi:alpha-mannosidase